MPTTIAVFPEHDLDCRGYGALSISAGSHLDVVLVEKTTELTVGMLYAVPGKEHVLLSPAPARLGLGLGVIGGGGTPPGTAQLTALPHELRVDLFSNDEIAAGLARPALRRSPAGAATTFPVAPATATYSRALSLAVAGRRWLRIHYAGLGTDTCAFFVLGWRYHAVGGSTQQRSSHLLVPTKNVDPGTLDPGGTAAMGERAFALYEEPINQTVIVVEISCDEVEVWGGATTGAANTFISLEAGD